MSYESLLQGLYKNNLTDTRPNTIKVLEPVQDSINLIQVQEEPINLEQSNNVDLTALFSVDRFKQLLKDKVAVKNKQYQNFSETINS